MARLEEIREVILHFDFPASKEQIIEMASKAEAPDDVMERLQCIPEYYYGSVNSVMETLRDLR